jgi:hypothetical protein
LGGDNRCIIPRQHRDNALDNAEADLLYEVKLTRLDSRLLAGGGRRFAALPETVDFASIRRLVTELPGATLLSFVETIPEVFVVFDYLGCEITINNQFGEYWFIAHDPHTPDERLEELVFFFRRHLPPRNHVDDERAAWATGGALCVATSAAFIVSWTAPEWSSGALIAVFLVALASSRAVFGRKIRR